MKIEVRGLEEGYDSDMVVVLGLFNEARGKYQKRRLHGAG